MYINIHEVVHNHVSVGVKCVPFFSGFCIYKKRVLSECCTCVFSLSPIRLPLVRIWRHSDRCPCRFIGTGKSSVFPPVPALTCKHCHNIFGESDMKGREGRVEVEDNDFVNIMAKVVMESGQAIVSCLSAPDRYVSRVETTEVLY